MSTARITLPPAVSARAKQRASERGCKSLADYVRALIDEDSPTPISPKLEAQLLKSLASPAREATAQYWASKRRRLRDAVRKSKAE